MDNRIFTVEEVAKILEMHPRTIRRYIRDDVLKAKKIGGQWRVKSKDLMNFMDDEENVEKHKKKVEDDLISFVKGKDQNDSESIQVCTIIDLHVNSIEEVKPYTEVLIDMMNSRDDDKKNTKFQYTFDEEESRARFTLWGNPKFLSKMLSAVSHVQDES